MNCPVCDRQLKSIQAGPIEVNACEGGCGGLWFDWIELNKVDEPLGYAGEELMKISRDDRMPIDRERRRACPRCADQPMRRHYFRVKRTVEVDECPECGGFWLDSQDLGLIREISLGDAQAPLAAQEACGAIIAHAQDARPQSPQERLRKARRIEHLFRFICLSFYLSGKQDQGAT